MIIIYIYKKYYNFIHCVYIRSTIDGNYYRVKDDDKKHDAANILAIISKRIDYLIYKLKDNKMDNRNVELLIKRYNKDNVLENLDTSSTSYTMNKGSEIALCLSSKDTDKHHDINDLMFVVLHELSHVGSESNGHNKEFVNFFVYLLKKSIDYKIYKYEDYSKNPVEYCGITIDNSPI